MPARPKCTHCGGSNILFDAYAVYNFVSDAFELFDVMDNGHWCSDCDGECSVAWANEEAQA